MWYRAGVVVKQERAVVQGNACQAAARNVGKTRAPPFIVTVATPSVDGANMFRLEELLMTMLALPAVLLSENWAWPPAATLMVALPAVLLFENSTWPPASAISRAVPPDDALLKKMDPPAAALMVALPAV